MYSAVEERFGDDINVSEIWKTWYERYGARDIIPY